MNINEITLGMYPHEKEIYFKHQEKRHKEEQEKLEQEKERLHGYKLQLIEDILKVKGGKVSKEYLEKFTTRTLERIFDYC